MKYKKSVYTALGLLVVIPTIVSAQTTFQTLVNQVGRLVGNLIPIVSAIALLVFIWGLVKFIFNAEDSGKRAEGRQFMFWGIIALFVLFSIWGILRFIGNSLNIRPGGSSINPPTLNFDGSGSSGSGGDGCLPFVDPGCWP